MVHWNTAYADINAALDEADGLAVLGFLIDSGKEKLGAFSSIVRASNKIKQKDQETDMSIFLSKFFNAAPNMLDYYTYSGSLTTPTCNEAVTWVVFKEPMIARRKVRNNTRN